MRFAAGASGIALFWADLLLLMASHIELLPAALRQIRIPPAETLRLAQ